MSEIRRHDKTNLRNTIALGATIITRRRRATPRDARTRTNADMTTDARGERAALLGRDVSSTPRANADAAVLDVERGDDGAGRRDGRARGGRRVAVVVAAALAATAVTIGAVRGTAGAGGAAALGSKPTASAKALRNARIAAAA